MFNDTYFKATNTEPLIYRFGSAYIYGQNILIHLMWADIYPSSGIVVSHMVIKLKREADSLEVDIHIY